MFVVLTRTISLSFTQYVIVSIFENNNYEGSRKSTQHVILTGCFLHDTRSNTSNSDLNSYTL